jgi:hypothetical protein
MLADQEEEFRAQLDEQAKNQVKHEMGVAHYKLEKENLEDYVFWLKNKIKNNET